MSRAAALRAACLAAALSGCATIMNGSKQEYRIASSPPQARITVDGRYTGMTPATLELDRDHEHTVRLELAGYAPATVRVENTTSGWFWVNLLAPPLYGAIFMPVDWLSGSMDKLMPDRIHEDLAPLAGTPAGGGMAAPPPRDPTAPRLNVAVSELAADAVSSSDAAVIANLLRGELVKTGAFNVVEKKNMDRILAEQAFQQTGCTAQDCAVRLGKLLNVQRMVVGSCGKLMGKYFISIRVVNVESGEAVFADDAKGTTVDDIETGIRDLATRMAARRL